jgi:ABC-type nitrate/sulfonate/bicarbonate transport system permease component
VFLAALIAVLLWQATSQLLLTYAFIPRLSDVLQELIVALVKPYPEGIWPDIRLSLLEILAGILWAGLFAIPTVGLFQQNLSLKRWQGFLALSSISPIVLCEVAIIWLGIGFILKAFVVSCFVYFPIVQAVWTYRYLSWPSRLLLAIDEALPYAFLGMLFEEAFAATGGLGFALTVAQATKLTAKAFAICLILFGCLATLSGILRWAIKKEVLQMVPDEARDRVPRAALG